ncbi:MAG: hypothetical protein PVG65_00300 [Candidatus Thorarchaeota archaeon]
MASNGQIFGWTAAVIAVVYTAVNGLEYLLVGVGFGILCGIFLVICNMLYQKSKNSEDQSSSVAVSQRPLQIPPRIQQIDQTGPRIVSITDQNGRQYPVPPQRPPYSHTGTLPPRRTGPALQGIDYSRAECVICLSPADFFCKNCGQTYCKKHATEANYLCPDCHVRLIPIRRVR